MTEPKTQYQLQLPLSEIQKPIDSPFGDMEQRLQSLLACDLTFKGEKTDSATHRLHAFPAKFPPQLPRLFIEKLTRPGEWELDPMAGSGTALVEAVLAGRHAIAVDLDPLAIRIARVKTMPFALTACAKAGNRVVQRARRSLNTASSNGLSRAYAPEAIEFFNYWFEEHTIHELYALARQISKVEDTTTRTFLEVVLSSAIITKHGTLTRALDLAHSRPHRDLNKKVDENAIDFFDKRLRAVIESLESMKGITTNALVIRSDARSLPLQNNSSHLIITSPPYAANAIDYMRANKFSLLWLGEDPKSLTHLRKRYIGAELRPADLECASETANRVVWELKAKHEGRAAVVAHYFRDLTSALSEMLRVLHYGRAAVIVVGSSTIQGIEIKAPTVLAELARSVGFEVVGVARREILRNARMMPVSHKLTEAASKQGCTRRA